MLELTTVANDEAVAHEGLRVRHYPDLRPGAEHRCDGLAFRTLPDLGPQLATLATVNDVHIGETVCGQIQGTDIGPVFRSEPGETPYPEVMSRAAIAEMVAAAPDLVVAKGDLTSGGGADEMQGFLDLYGGAFGDRLVHVPGNHEVYGRPDAPPAEPRAVDLPGVRVAVLDTSWPGHPGGRLLPETLAWLDAVAGESDRPLLVMGHHPVCDPETADRSKESFLLQPESTDALLALVARRPRVRGYFAGHTHRNRVRRFAATGDVPFAEVSSVKDYPGAWAEYRICERGVLQIVRRVSDPAALAWTEKTRAMFNGGYADYAFGGLDERCFAIRWDDRTGLRV